MQLMSSGQWVTALTLLFLMMFAPACAPKEVPPLPVTLKNLVLLTDTTKWDSASLQDLRDSLATSNYRVITSGYSGETADQLIARLPWLLQPGIDLFLYDENLAGAAGYDSLVNYLHRNGLETKVKAISQEQ